MIRRLLITALLAGILTTTPGCAALVVGYLVGDAIQRDRAVATCRSNLQTQNQARLAKGQDLFPDQCAK